MEGPSTGEPVAAAPRDSRDRAVAHALPVVAILGAVAHLVIAPLAAFFEPTGSAPGLILSACVAAVHVGVYAYARSRFMRPALAHPVLASLFLISAGATFFAMWSGAHADGALSVLLLTLGAGVLMLSWPWFVVTVAAIVGGGTAVAAWGASAVGPADLVVIPAAAVVMAALAHATRISAHDRVEAHIERETRLRRELEAAVEGARDALATARAGEERFRALVQNSTDLITVARSDGTLAYVSPAMEFVFGHRVADVVGRDVLALLHPDDLPEAQAAFARVLDTPGLVVQHSSRMRCADGRWADVESTVQNLIDNAAVGGIVANTRDVTDRRRSEEMLRRSERLASLGTLVAGVAHEVNNPLMFMRGNVDLLEYELADVEARPDLPPEVRDALQNMREHASVVVHGIDRIARITSSLRHVVQPGEGKRGVIDPNETVRHVLELTAAHYKTDLEVATDLGARHSVSADPDELAQVLLNLVMNGADAMADAPAKVLTVRTFDEAGAVVLEVEDKGSGIGPEARTHLFTPFFTTKPRGTGLGLSICHRIVEDHGGRISFRSAPERGTVFRVELPRADAETRPQ